MADVVQTITVDRSREPETAKQAYQAIGRFVAYFSQLEDALRWIVAAELNLWNDKEREPVLNLIDYSGLCNAAKRLLLLQKPEARPTEKVINDVIRRCMAMGGQRNIVAHGGWNIQKGARHVNRQTLEPKYSFQQLEELESKTEEIWNLSMEVLDLYVTYLPDKGAGAIQGGKAN